MAVEKTYPSMDEWLKEAKQDENASQVGMYLFHHGVVRATPKKLARAVDDADRAEGEALGGVDHVSFSYDKEGLEKAVEEARTWPGVYYVRVWLNEGDIAVGDPLMQVLVGADIRPNTIDALVKLVGHIKSHLVEETEVYTD